MIDLKIILEKYPQSTVNKVRLAAILRDLYPRDRRALNLALMVYESGITSKIADLKEIDVLQQKHFIKQLVDEYGLQECYAAEGIELWAKAYDLEVPPYRYTQLSNTNTHPEYNTNDSAKSGQKLSVVISGYEIKEVEGGFEICRFLGDEEENIVVPNNIDEKKIVGIGKNAFKNCKNLKAIEISDGVVYIEDGAFANCKNLKSVIFPESLERIGSESNDGDWGAFYHCGLEKIVFPKGLTFIGERAFRFCNRLKTIIISNTVEIIGKEAFSGCSNLVNIQFASSLKEIGIGAFGQCRAILKLDLNEGLVSIGDGAFSNCLSLIDVRFPHSLRKIGNGAFENCKAIATVILNEGLVSIGRRAFSDCNSLNNLLIPRSVSNIGNVYPDVFGNKYSYKSSLIIYCYAYTYAYKYAKENGYQFQNAEFYK